MKKIIALASFVFMILMTVLPAGVSHAAANNAVQLTGISFVLDNNKTIDAVKVGDNKFYLDLVGDEAYGNQTVKEVVLKSDNAAALSVLPANFNYKQLEATHLTKDDYDIQFVNGEAVLDAKKLIGWATRVNNETGGKDNIPAADDLGMTVNDFKSGMIPLAAAYSELIQNPNSDQEPASPYVVTGYLTDKAGNESTVTLTAKTEGWKQVNKKWYYLDDQGQSVKNDWVSDSGKWYFLGQDGAMKTGWVKSGSKWYYLKANGAMATGWVKVSGKWYYLDANSGAMKTSWVKLSNKWYYLDANSGAMKTGWVKSSNKWYYFDTKTGAMKTGWVKVSNKWYYLYSDGHMAANTKIGSYKIGKNGAWIK